MDHRSSSSPLTRGPSGGHQIEDTPSNYRSATCPDDVVRARSDTQENFCVATASAHKTGFRGRAGNSRFPELGENSQSPPSRCPCPSTIKKESGLSPGAEPSEGLDLQASRVLDGTVDKTPKSKKEDGISEPNGLSESGMRNPALNVRKGVDQNGSSAPSKAVRRGDDIVTNHKICDHQELTSRLGLSEGTVIRTNHTPALELVVRKGLGFGGFGVVIECFVTKWSRDVAVKIYYWAGTRTAASYEVNLVRDLNKKDKNRDYFVKTHGLFTYRGHPCLIFEKLGLSMDRHLLSYNADGLPIDTVRKIARWLLQSVQLVHDHGFIHTDLKPDNILATNLHEPKKLRLIDFGSATSFRKANSARIGTENYRAPEVILGIGWSYPADLWSIGCTIWEALTGTVLFQGHCRGLHRREKLHLELIRNVIGPFPAEMIQHARKAKPSLVRGFSQKLMSPGEAGRVDGHTSRTKLRSRLYYYTQDPTFYDFLERLLEIDPMQRITCRGALEHKFICG